MQYTRRTGKVDSVPAIGRLGVAEMSIAKRGIDLSLQSVFLEQHENRSIGINSPKTEFLVEVEFGLPVVSDKSHLLINQFEHTVLLNDPSKIERHEALQQLRLFIAAGGYSPGDRLPAERELIDQLEVTRTQLRKGLDTLEREGAIWRHVGKGTFIAGTSEGDGFSALAELSQQVTPLQMMRARLALEPAIAKEAALNASADALIRVRDARDRAESATSWDSYETNDDAFHRSIAEATGNVLLRSLFDHMNQVRRAVAWRQVIRKTNRPPKDHPSFIEHNLIVSAIQERDPGAAHNAMRDHLNSVSVRLFGEG